MLKAVKNLLIATLLLIICSLFSATAFASTPPDLAHSGLSVSSVVPADGQTQVTVTVTLKNTSGIAVSGDTVVLKSPNDSTAVITPTSSTIDGEGHAIFKITSRSPGTYRLNVTDTTTNTPFNGLGNVIFNPSSEQYPCANPIPGSIPQLTLAEALNPNRIALIWTKSTDPVSHYSVSYGLASGQYQYGNPRIGGRDTTSFIIDSLSPNTKYYFIIKAVNGCTSGNSSNELSATTLTTEITPVPTLTPTPTIAISPSPTIISTASAVPTQIPTIVSSTTIPTQTKPTVESLSAASTERIVILAIIILVIFCIALLVFLLKKKRAPATSELLDTKDTDIKL